MYNTTVKNRFIYQYSQSKHMQDECEKIFNLFEAYENQWNADLCTRSAEELQPIIDKMVGVRSRSQIKQFAILREYAKWCLGVGIEGATKGVLEVDTLGLSKLRLQMIPNPMSLQKFCDDIFEPESDETVDNINRCFLWLAFSGMSEKEIIDVNSSDVDIQHMVINYKGRQYPIYPQAIPALKNCVSLDRFAYKHKNYVQNFAYRERVQSEKLMRGIKCLYSIIALREAVSREAGASDIEGNRRTNLYLTHYRVYLSGIFYRAYEMEKAGYTVSFSDAADKFLEDRGYTVASYGEKELISKKKQVVRDYEVDYQRWKIAFFL